MCLTMRPLAIFEDISLSNVSSISCFQTFGTKPILYKVACIDAPCPCASTSGIRYGYHRIASEDETYSGRSRLSSLP